jgi:hypothetical protein
MDIELVQHHCVDFEADQDCADGYFEPDERLKTQLKPKLMDCPRSDTDLPSKGNAK